MVIDRAWWRANQPGQHYAQLSSVCTEIADRITATIDRQDTSSGPPKTT